MNLALSVRDLSKRFRIGSAARSPYRTLRESLANAFRRNHEADDNRDVWALRGVNFTVNRGEVVGIVGRNGAGKSTLLKLLSRISPPTDGAIDIHGRVGSLLEVGTGFHNELTGRENIFLNGAILGMRRREIEKKFDQIVEFSEVGKFLDTPVKRYSSGMYMKLAFAVASHLEPEILVVDEVLAVGDAAFQKKCLGKMGEVSRTGRTILFVSHNMTAVKALCTRAIMIDGGKVVADGDVDDVVNRYLTLGATSGAGGVIPHDTPRQQDITNKAFVRSVRLTNTDGQESGQLYFGQSGQVHFQVEVLAELPESHFEVSISTLDGTHVTYSTTLDGGVAEQTMKPGLYDVTATLDAVLLPRAYTIDLGVHQNDGTTLDFVQRVLDFHVLRVAEGGNDHYRWGNTRGLIRAATRWTSHHEPTSPVSAR
jgi:lipopolysaccharide transport system ATP-binding protein